MNLFPKDKDKRNQLIVTLVIIVALLSLFVFGVIRPQYKSLATAAKNIAAEQANLQKNQGSHQKERHHG